ncbi:MAG TPA: BlaI/MecI/CopY family transcriptional regulator [Haliangiales bacterium]|nr:BlaI/MecI/CopY family transcriptional regulator [Haliangiales bacterium]
MDNETQLSRRERQIMDIVYQRGRATVADVIEKMTRPPSYSAVRAMMGILEQKGHLRHEQDGARYVYLPTVPVSTAQRSALKRLVRTFFNGSPREAIAALAELPEAKLSKDELRALSRLIEQSEREGR